MMKQSKLIFLCAIALALVLLAHVTGSRRRTRPHEAVGRLLLADFDLNSVHAVDVERDGNAVRIRHDGRYWSVTNAFDYPADIDRLRRGLLSLRDLRIGHAQPAMQIDRATAPRIRLLDAESTSLAEITIGPRRGGDDGWGRGRYLFVGEDDTGFLVMDDLNEFTARARDWLDTDITSVPASDVARIEMIPDDAPPMSFVRRDGQLRMEGLAENESFDSTHRHGLESALAYLRFNDVAPPEHDDVSTGISTGHVFRVTTRDDRLYTIRIGGTDKRHGGRYMRITANIAPEKTSQEDSAALDGDSDAAREATEQARREALQTVDEFNARHAPWTYIIASHNAETMTRPRDELVKIEEPETEADPAPATEATIEFDPATEPSAVTEVEPEAAEREDLEE